MRGKKGQIEPLIGVVSALIIIGLFIGVGFIILESFKDQSSLDDTAVRVAGENDTWLNLTGYTLDGASSPGFNVPVIVSMANATHGNNSAGYYNLTIPAANYSVDKHGIVRNATTLQYDNVSIVYTYNKGETAWVGVNSSIEAMTTVPDLLGLIILIVIVGIILAIVFNVMPMSRVSGA